MSRKRIAALLSLALLAGAGSLAVPARAAAEETEPSMLPAGSDAAGQPDALVDSEASGQTDRRPAATVPLTDPVSRQDPLLSVASEGVSLRLTVSGFAESPSNVAFAVTPAGSTTRWFQAKPSAEGAWEATLSGPASLGAWGAFKVEAFATVGGATRAVASSSGSLAKPTVQVVATSTGDTLETAALRWSAEPDNVAFAVRSASTGKVAWLQGVRQADGSWRSTASVSGDLGAWGAYTVEAYATFGPLTSGFGSAQARASIGEVSTGASVSGTAVTIKAAGWAQAPQNVAFEIRGPKGSARWVQAERQADGSWSAQVSVTDALGAWGAYQVRTWASLNGIAAAVSESAFTASAGNPLVSATGDGASILLSAGGWSVQPTNVAFQVRRPNGGEIWIQARRGSDGTWTASTSAMAGGVIDNGTYAVTAWATHGKLVAAAGSTSFNAQTAGPSASARVAGQNITFSANGFSEVSSNVAFEVRTPSGRTVWLQARRASDDTWSAVLSAAATIGEPGSYTAVLWATFGGRTASYSSSSATVASLSASVTVSKEGAAVRAQAGSWSSSPSNVAFEVVDGDRSTWIQAVRGANGAWSAAIPASGSTLRQVRAWGTVGKMTCLAGTTAITPTAPTAAVSITADGANLLLEASGWEGAPVNVAFQLVTPGGKEVWLQAAPQVDGTWSARASVASTGGQWGPFTVLAWATSNGATKPVGADSVNVSAGQVSTFATASGTAARLSVSGWSLSPANVAFKVVKPTGEVIWVQGVRQPDGSWVADLSLMRDLKAWGSFTAQTYATLDGATYGFDTARFSFSAGSARVSKNVADTSFSLSVSGWTRVPSNVAFRIDTPVGERWLQARRQADGSWTAWASQGDGFWAQGTYTATAFATIEGITSPFGSTSFSFPRFQNAMHQRAQWYSSSTNWLILVDTAACRVGVYNGRQGSWNQVFYWLCSPGAPATPTVKGEFTVAARGYVFGHGYSCYYWTQFYGDYLFHSVLYNQNSSTIQDGRLGQQLSHGCVRLAIENARWINQNIPSGTKVAVY